MSAYVRRLFTALPRRLPGLSRPRQLAWGLRLIAVCLANAAVSRLSLATRRCMRRTRRRLVGIRRIWIWPNNLAVVLLVRRSPGFAIRLRWRALDPRFFKSEVR